MQVKSDDEIMMITDNGTLVRIAVADVSEMGRNTQGVRLIRLTKGEKLVEIERIEALPSSDSDDAAGDDNKSEEEGE